jgi:hypothetical protein
MRLPTRSPAFPLICIGLLSVLLSGCGLLPRGTRQITSTPEVFCQGYSAGYRAGWCYQQLNCQPPRFPPPCPLPTVADEMTYEGGYESGFADGMNALK